MNRRKSVAILFLGSATLTRMSIRHFLERLNVLKDDSINLTHSRTVDV